MDQRKLNEQNAMLMWLNKSVTKINDILQFLNII